MCLFCYIISGSSGILQIVYKPLTVLFHKKGMVEWNTGKELTIAQMETFHQWNKGIEFAKRHCHSMSS